MSEDNHHSSLLRDSVVAVAEQGQAFDPYWNIEVCHQCGGSGSEPSGVEYMGIGEMVGCESCCGIGYTNERIQELLNELYG